MATKAQHTPGPWAVSHNRPFNGAGACVRDSHGRMVADCHTFDQLDRQREANARLIAEAPELREAVVSAEEALGENLVWLADKLDILIRQKDGETLRRLDQLNTAWKALCVAKARVE